MSAKPTEEAAPKKKGKMPLIMIVALVIGGGGYMKMSGGKKKEEPKVELGAVVPLPKEVLVNLREQDSYLRAEISVHLIKGVDGKKFGEYFPVLQNAFIMRLSGLDVADLTSAEDKAALKRVLAKDANDALKLAGFKLPGEEAEDDHDKKKKKKKKDDEEEESTELEYPEFDSDTGPILKVYFTSFATQ